VQKRDLYEEDKRIIRKVSSYLMEIDSKDSNEILVFVRAIAEGKKVIIICLNQTGYRKDGQSNDDFQSKRSFSTYDGPSGIYAKL
jgi:archaellum biogenesis ATPase FlaH